jgi:serine/threonine protein kinase
MNNWVGQTVGKVHIDALLARGGMAEVYIGTHLTLHRKVAVKVLRNNYSEHAHALKRFQREAIVVGNLRHPNIVQVFDFDLVDSHPYLVMEYIKGPSLQKYLSSLHDMHMRLDFSQVSRFMDAMTSALQYAHDRGVIHRDIKPGNILLTSRTSDILLGKPLPDDFEPVLTDFGLVRFIDSTQHTTSSGEIAGTPAYMSPEQASGELTDGRTDVYSLGIVLYEILAGHVPFEGETTMGVLMKHINEPPAPVSGLPPAIQYLLDRALAKNVNDRFQTPAEFGDAFKDAIEERADFPTYGLPTLRPTGKPSKGLFKSNQRQKMIIPALVSLMVIAAAGLFFSNALPVAFGGTSTATPSSLSTDTIPVPSNTAKWTEAAIPTILLGRTGMLQFENGSAVANQADFIAAALLAPPPGSQYEVWLVEDSGLPTSLGILSLDASGKGKLTFTDKQGSNLIAKYSGVEVTIEPNPDPDPKSSGIVAYSSYYPRESLPHLRSLLASFPNTPDQKSLIEGLNTDIQTIDEFAKEMKRSSMNGNQDRARLFAEAILNIIVGDQSPDHKDWNADGKVDDASDGYGLLLNGRNLGYLEATYIEADAVSPDGSSEKMVTNGRGVKTSVQNLAQWTEQLEAVITPILAQPSPSDLGQLVTQAATLTDKMLNGIDMNEDGVVEPIPGEGGMKVAIEQAYRMADMSLLAVGIQNIGTGTPTFILILPSQTPGEGSRQEGATAGPTQHVTAGPTQHVPPGQQRTSRPPPGQQKTKEPPPSQHNTRRPNSGNNGSNNGNNNGNSGTP